ncbi:hypothetical protein V5O48_002469 [Marasmius crinis-equi]|uniref:Uncharacterized protein n=1 Tax=Marasmius crinis-equi TaxID=585013 RepID=A0ABR3FW21_9AGAR
MNTIDPDLASQVRSAAMRGRRNVSQGYATYKDPLQPPGPSSRTKSLSTNDIFRSSNDIMHDVFASTNPVDPSGIPTQPSNKRARSEDRDTDPRGDDSTGANRDIAMNLNTPLDDRPIKPLRKSGKSLMQTRSLPASLWPTASAESGGVIEEEDWSASMDGGSKPFEPMTLS